MIAFYFQEIDILLIRLDYLYDLVDKFIIVEVAKALLEKRIYFRKNIRLLKNILIKFIIIKLMTDIKIINPLLNFSLKE